MEDNQNKILTPAEVGKMFNLRIDEVYSLARRGLIPGRKVGHYWRFYLPTLLKWIGEEH